MPMRDQPEGVNRVRRGTERPAKAYDIMVDGEYAGWVERLEQGVWRAYREGSWPRKFPRPGGFLAAAKWITELHRAARKTTEPVTAAESAEVRQLPRSVADPFGSNPIDPFWGDPFADPLT